MRKSSFLVLAACLGIIALYMFLSDLVLGPVLGPFLMLLAIALLGLRDGRSVQDLLRPWWVAPLVCAFFIGPFIPMSYARYRRSAVVDSAWSWTRGKIYCNRCHANERINTIVAEERNGDFWNVYVSTQRHKDEIFECTACVDGTSLRSLSCPEDGPSEVSYRDE